jgi:hypothetical protein
MKRLATLTTAVVLCLGSNVLAQEKQHVSFKAAVENSKYIVSQNVDVGDVPNHIVRLFDTHNTLPNTPVIVDGLKLVDVFSRGTADLTDGQGGGQGYLVFVAENGDKFFSRNNLVAQQASGKLAATWAGSITGGTGRLAGIHGMTRLLSNFDPSPGGSVSNTQIDIEYSINK